MRQETGDKRQVRGKRVLSPVPCPLSPVSRGGFTLVELLVVLGIIGLLLGIGVPSMAAFSQRARMQATTRQLIGLLTLARSMAISSHEPHAVRFDAAAREVTVINVTSEEALEQRLHLPPAMTIELEQPGAQAPPTEVVFQPSGSLIGRSVQVRVADRGRSQVIVVSAITGAVRLERAPREPS